MDDIRRLALRFPAALPFAIAALPLAAQTPSPALLVLNKAEATVAIVDPASGDDRTARSF